MTDLAAVIARDHHERWDGSGYPNAIPGDAIAIEARITSVADFFDALTTERPYKEAWPVPKALDFLRDHRASQFDAALVDAFLRDPSQIEQIRARFPDDETPPASSNRSPVPWPKAP